MSNRPHREIFESASEFAEKIQKTFPSVTTCVQRPGDHPLFEDRVVLEVFHVSSDFYVEYLNLIMPMQETCEFIIYEHVIEGKGVKDLRDKMRNGETS